VVPHSTLKQEAQDTTVCTLPTYTNSTSFLVERREKAGKATPSDDEGDDKIQDRQASYPLLPSLSYERFTLTDTNSSSYFNGARLRLVAGIVRERERERERRNKEHFHITTHIEQRTPSLLR
jgi:hypothetical protein